MKTTNPSYVPDSLDDEVSKEQIEELEEFFDIKIKDVDRDDNANYLMHRSWIASLLKIMSSKNTDEIRETKMIEGMGYIV